MQKKLAVCVVLIGLRYSLVPPKDLLPPFEHPQTSDLLNHYPTLPMHALYHSSTRPHSLIFPLLFYLTCRITQISVTRIAVL